MSTAPNLQLFHPRTRADNPLLDLPTSIRDRIYANLLVVDEPIETTHHRFPNYALFEVCRETRNDAFRVFYGQNVFVVRVDFKPARLPNFAHRYGAAIRRLCVVVECEVYKMADIKPVIGIMNSEAHQWDHLTRHLEDLWLLVNPVIPDDMDPGTDTYDHWMHVKWRAWLRSVAAYVGHRACLDDALVRVNRGEGYADRMLDNIARGTLPGGWTLTDEYSHLFRFASDRGPDLVASYGQLSM